MALGLPHQESARKFNLGICHKIHKALKRQATYNTDQHRSTPINTGHLVHRDIPSALALSGWIFRQASQSASASSLVVSKGRCSFAESEIWLFCAWRSLKVGLVKTSRCHAHHAILLIPSHSISFLHYLGKAAMQQCCSQATALQLQLRLPMLQLEMRLRSIRQEQRFQRLRLRLNLCCHLLRCRRI